MSSPPVCTAALRIDLAVNNNLGGSTDRTLIQDPVATSNPAALGIISLLSLVGGVAAQVCNSTPGLQTLILIPQANAGTVVTLLANSSDTGIQVDANSPIVFGCAAATSLSLLSPTPITYQIILV